MRLKTVITLFFVGLVLGCSGDGAPPSLVTIPEYNDEIVKNLEQAQLDELCAQSQQAGLDYMERHQANFCGVAALLASEEKGLDCAEEYDKCMAIDIQTEFLDLCAQTDRDCGCWDKETSTPAFNCFDTVTEFGSCLAEIYETVDQTHAEVQVRCSDEDSHWLFEDTSNERVPPCVDAVFPSCLLIFEVNWSYRIFTLYEVLYL